MKKNDSLRRRRSFRIPRARFLIVCEGELTEPAYFNDIRLSERGILELKIVPGGTPKTVVERAVELLKQSKQDVKRYRDENRRYDSVWCVFDVDEHPYLPESKQQAHAHSISVAVSNCFESMLRVMVSPAFPGSIGPHRPAESSASLPRTYAGLSKSSSL